MKSADQQLLEEAYTAVLNYKKQIVNESTLEQEIKDCEDVIKKLSKGEFKNETEEVMDHVKNCKNVFSVTKDEDGQYTVIIKDSALYDVERLYPELTGKFKSATECREDVAKCRQDKM